MRPNRLSNILSRAAFAALAVVSLVTSIGCGGGPSIDPILQLSTQEALERGKALIEEGKYNRASRYFSHAFESSPNSREGREGLLLAANALFEAGGIDNYVRCEAKYRDFINRFPTSDQADYAQFQVANCLSERMEKPDRDQEVARKALEEYEELFRLYPTSSHLGIAEEHSSRVRNQLAESEFMVGAFYLRYRLCRAAINRLEPIQDEYPSYQNREVLLASLVMAYIQCRLLDKANDTYLELIEAFPDSKQKQKLSRELEKARKRQEEG